MIISKIFEFSAAHILPFHKGKCCNIHGHNYEMEVHVETWALDANEMLLDFGDLKQIVKEHILDKVDHTFVLGTEGVTQKRIKTFCKENNSKVYELPSRWATAESIANHFALVIQGKLSKISAIFGVKVTLWETSNSKVETDWITSSQLVCPEVYAVKVVHRGAKENE